MSAARKDAAARITAPMILHALAERYCTPEWIFMAEVRSGTGFPRDLRSADALAFCTWPSRGLELHGFEIKVSKADWKREREDPRKAEEIARHCDRWWLAAPVGLIDVGEVPPDWGLVELHPDGILRTVREPAAPAERAPMPRAFVASMLRVCHASASSGAVSLGVDKQLEKRYQAGLAAGRAESESARVRAEAERDRIAADVRDWQARTGLHLREYSGNSLGMAAQAVLKMSHWRHTLDACRAEGERVLTAIAEASEHVPQLDVVRAAWQSERAQAVEHLRVALAQLPQDDANAPARAFLAAYDASARPVVESE